MPLDVASRPPAVENTEFVAMMRRLIRALRKRIGDSDPDGLADMLALASELEDAVGLAVHDMRERYGFSWTDIGRAVGTTRQAAQMRYGRYCTSEADS